MGESFQFKLECLNTMTAKAKNNRMKVNTRDTNGRCFGSLNFKRWVFRQLCTSPRVFLGTDDEHCPSMAGSNGSLETSRARRRLELSATPDVAHQWLWMAPASVLQMAQLFPSDPSGVFRAQHYHSVPPLANSNKILTSSYKFHNSECQCQFCCIFTCGKQPCLGGGEVPVATYRRSMKTFRGLGAQWKELSRPSVESNQAELGAVSILFSIEGFQWRSSN